MANNEIIITHFVNPHYFFYRWVKDECHDEELSVMERKIEAVAKSRDTNSNVSEQNSAETPDSNSIVSTSLSSMFRSGDVVGVFVPFFHKYIRASVREDEINGHFSLWCIDYGFPIVAKASNVFKLPRSFHGLQIKSKRIFRGGMENVMPAEMNFCVLSQCGVKEIVPNWSEKYTEILKNVIYSSKTIHFENVKEYINPKDKKVHYFGRLMIQRPDNQMANAVKCLLEMNCACLIEGSFADEIKFSETINAKNIGIQKNDHQFWNTHLITTAIKLENEKVLNDDDTIDEIKDDMTNYMSDNEFFDDSVSLMKPEIVYLADDGKNQQQIKCGESVEDEAKVTMLTQELKTSVIEETNLSKNSPQKTPITEVHRLVEHRNTPPDRKMQSDQRQYNPRTQQFQHQNRGSFRQFHSSQGNSLTSQAVQFIEPPSHPIQNQFNHPVNQFIQPLNQPNQPVHKFNQQQTGKRRRRNYKRKNASRNNSSDFEAIVGHRPLDGINENSQMGPSNPPPNCGQPPPNLSQLYPNCDQLPPNCCQLPSNPGQRPKNNNNFSMNKRNQYSSNNENVDQNHAMNSKAQKTNKNRKNKSGGNNNKSKNESVTAGPANEVTATTLTQGENGALKKNKNEC